MPLQSLGLRLLVKQGDMETGEPRLDRETGEEVAVSALRPCPRRGATASAPPPPPAQSLDAETGEPEGQPTAKRKPFQIPRSALAEPRRADMQFDSQPLGAPPPPPDAAPVADMAHASCLQRKMEYSANMSPILFMLPTVFLFPAWASVLLIVFELVCHAYVHKKNKLLPRTSKLVYRSPLHLITSVFCAYCQSDKLMVKIGKMQDERLLRAHRKELAYCSYVERVSVVS